MEPSGPRGLAGATTCAPGLPPTITKGWGLPPKLTLSITNMVRVTKARLGWEKACVDENTAEEMGKSVEGLYRLSETSWQICGLIEEPEHIQIMEIMGCHWQWVFAYTNGDNRWRLWASWPSCESEMYSGKRSHITNLLIISYLACVSLSETPSQTRITTFLASKFWSWKIFSLLEEDYTKRLGSVYYSPLLLRVRTGCFSKAAEFWRLRVFATYTKLPIPSKLKKINTVDKYLESASIHENLFRK